VLTGQAAYGDWSEDKPGLRRLIRPSDMPHPATTVSVSNGPHVVPRPAGAELHLPDGFSVTAFATGLKDPRQMKIAPNGDVFLAESGGDDIRVLRPVPGAGISTHSEVFADHLPARPYGIAFYPPGPQPKYVYVGVEDAVLRYPYRNGDMKARGAAEMVIPNLPDGHHWTRDLLFTPDGSKLLVGVGSGSNDAEEGMQHEARRANILEFNPDGSGGHVYAAGLRNPVTLGFEPQTGDLWTTVNERDTMGDNLPPDYVTHVAEGGFYGWPWYYIGSHEDPRYEGEHPEMRGKVRVPDVLLQPHSAPLGLAFYTGTPFPGMYHGGLFVALHGSWNRAKRTGYKVVFLPFSGGTATGEYDDFLTGFVTPEGNVWGRPVGLAVAQDGALLVSDDASGTIWRVAYVE
jgi:glucose/arabinose dehydrogenase